MPATIAGLHTRLITVPLRRSWGADAPENHIIATSLFTDDGGAGHGFSWTPTIGPQAVKALLDHDIAPFITGLDANPEAVWDQLWKRLHEAGGGGLTTIAMTGVDLALWDLAARTAGVPVAAVLGPDRRLMVDANQRWDLPAALRALDVLGQYGLDWLEEPLRADDLSAYRRLRKQSPVPIALGENVHTIYRFRDFIEAEAVDIIQPNIIRVGGITPFRRIVELARANSIRVAPHLLPELSGQLALTLAEAVSVEDVEDASFEQLGILAGPSPVRIRDSPLDGTGLPGLGFSFTAALLPEPRDRSFDLPADPAFRLS